MDALAVILIVLGLLVLWGAFTGRLGQMATAVISGQAP